MANGHILDEAGHTGTSVLLVFYLMRKSNNKLQLTGKLDVFICISFCGHFLGGAVVYVQSPQNVQIYLACTVIGNDLR